MNIKELRFAERWRRLEIEGQTLGVFLVIVSFCGLLLWALSEPARDPDICRRMGRRAICDADERVIVLTILFLLAYIACKLASDVYEEFCLPLQSRTFSPALRVFLSLKRMYLGEVTHDDSLELKLITLDDENKPYRGFVFKVCGIRKFTVYGGLNEEVSPNCIFYEGVTLEFSHLADSTGLDYARINVSCQYQGHYFSGQMELEADSYDLRMMPKQRV